MKMSNTLYRQVLKPVLSPDSLVYNSYSPNHPPNVLFFNFPFYAKERSKSLLLQRITISCNNGTARKT